MRKITPSVWGEPFWRAIHVVALGLPHQADRETKDAYIAFYESLKTVLPCVQCSQGYTHIVAALKPSISEAVDAGPDALFAWTVDVHNKVAEKLGQDAMTEDYVRDHYMFGDARVPDSTGAESSEAVGASEGPPWSQEVFQRHSRNPVIVYLAALFSLSLVGLVLWYSARACTRR
jgi:hypothetical protein